MSQSAHEKQTMGELRIIGGQWKRTKLTFPLLDGLRPTPSRIRETLFNWLHHDIAQTNCLDLFAGSGALGFEALSRGAKSVWMIDQAPDACKILKQHQQRLNTDSAHILQRDATQPESLETLIEQPVDIVFCDPPFNKGLVEPLLKQLEASNLLTADAIIYVETEAKLKQLVAPENWTLNKEKKAGDVIYRLYTKQ